MGILGTGQLEKQHLAARLVVCFLLSMCSGLATAEGGGKLQKKLQKLQEFRVTRSSSGRFAAVGRDATHNMDLLRWAEQMAERFERTTGLKPALSRNGQFRIVVEPENALDQPQATIRQRLEGQSLQQWLTIHDYDRADLDQVAERFCGLLLHGLIVKRMIDESKAAAEAAGTPWSTEQLRSFRPAAPPAWLSWGVAENAVPTHRARHRTAMLRRWIDNELRPLSRLLVSGMPPPGGSIQGEPDKAVATVLVAWVLDEDREGVKLGRLLDILGRGQRLPAARLAMVLTPGERPSRLDAQWEAWVRKQRRVVHMGLPLDPLTELQATLLLCPGESGIPEDEGFPERMPFDYLVRHREAHWIKACARIKATELRVVAVNKDESFQSVAAAYSAFLNALETGEPVEKLQALLDTANAGRRSYEASVRRTQAGGAQQEPRE